MIRRHRYLVFGLLTATCLVAAGCNSSPPLPRTYPVSGTVVYKAEQPMTGGSIQFKSSDDPMLRVVGEIGTDGTFTLRTVKDNTRGNGAPEGEYQVTVQPPAVEDPRGGVQGAHKYVEAIVLPQKFKVEAQENTFNIVLPVTRP